jgi:integrase
MQSTNTLLPRSLAPAVLKRLPRALSYDEIRLLFREASPTYRLIFKWALLTGMRRFEICQLQVEQIPSPQQLALSRDGFARLNVRRKGSRDITTHVPVRLIEETHWYLLTEHSSPRSEKNGPLFLNSRGTAIHRASVSRIFRHCADRVGTDATFHHLRHTFAIYVLKLLDSAEAQGQTSNPLKTLQVMMGHASFGSTEIYLRAMDVSSDAVMQALDYLYGATL